MSRIEAEKKLAQRRAEVKWMRRAIAWNASEPPPEPPVGLQTRGALTQVNTGIRAAANTLSFGIADNLEAASDALLQPGGLSGLGQRYTTNLADEHVLDAYNRRYRPEADKIGVVGGVGLGLLASRRLSGPFGVTGEAPLLPGAVGTISGREYIAAAGGGAASNIGAQLAVDRASGHKSTLGDVVGAGVGGVVGGGLAFFGPSAAGRANGFVTSIAQDIGNDRPISLERAGQAAALGGVFSGRYAQRAAKHADALPKGVKGKLGEQLGQVRSTVNTYVAPKARKKVTTSVGKGTYPDGIDGEIHFEHKFGPTATLSAGQIANRADRGKDFILYHFMPEDFGRILSMPAGTIGLQLARYTFDQLERYRQSKFGKYPVMQPGYP